MLPLSYFERLTSAHKLRSYAQLRERRGGIRVDCRITAQCCLLIGQTVQPPITVRIREVSQTGASFLAPQSFRPAQEVAIRMQGRDGVKYWLCATVRRCHQLDQLSHLVGIAFARVLYPGQDIRVGTKIPTLLWLDVDGTDTPEDPFLSAA